MIKRASLNQKFSGNFVKVAGADDYIQVAKDALDKAKFEAEGLYHRAMAYPGVLPAIENAQNFAANYGDDIGIGAGVAGAAGLGGAAALRNIKRLQRTNPGMLARLMGAKPTGLTRSQLNMLGGGLGLGAGVGAGMKADAIEQLAAQGYGKLQSLYGEILPS